ncbi:hypothetical protein AcetOrient_orf04835 [Acetobacter orientalis]|uniref:Uncharacterized protein n=1 Tax=Acetobacter orientalis TaxID=146474 RepID=A0A2Z5ZMA2_9PROT|nr:hypothetical protein AcetOrient_orf04835 [Acetobacter orientalis]
MSEKIFCVMEGNKFILCIILLGYYRFSPLGYFNTIQTKY